jgi:hypothetical protein
MMSRVRLVDLRSAAYFAALETERRRDVSYSHRDAARDAAGSVDIADTEQLARGWVRAWLERACVTRRWYGAAEDLPFLSPARARDVVARARELWSELVVEHDRAREALGIEAGPPSAMVPVRLNEDDVWVQRWLAG